MDRKIYPDIQIEFIPSEEETLLDIRTFLRVKYFSLWVLIDAHAQYEVLRDRVLWEVVASAIQDFNGIVYSIMIDSPDNYDLIVDDNNESELERLGYDNN